MSTDSIDNSSGEPPSATDSAGATALCIACGFCCDGTLHDHAALQPEDVDHARSLGLDVIDDGTKRLSFKLPCPRFDGCCSVFGDRPRVCAAYRCKLLKSLDEGDVSLTDAKATVSVARGLADALRSAAPGAVSTVELRFDAVRSIAGTSMPGQSNERKMRAVALHVFLEKHFLDQGSRLLDFDDSTIRGLS